MRLRTAAATLAATMVGGLGSLGLAAPPSAVASTPVAATATALHADRGAGADAAADEHRFTSWSQSIQRRSGLTFTNRTLRQVSRLTQGGDQVRLRLENTFGTAPMVVDKTTVGRTGTGAGIEAGTLRPVLFSGAEGVSIPAGGSVWSDPVDLATEAQEDVTISFYVRNATVTTLHDRAGRTNWFAPDNGGDFAGAESGAAFTETHGWNYIVGAIDVVNEDLAGTVVAYGSSVVDGSGSESCGPGCTETNPYMRWTDITARKITDTLPADRQLALVNAGIGGTTASPACGSGGLDGVSRLSRDVLSLHGVTALIYYYGTNDIANLGNGCSAGAIVSSMRATFSELRAAGIKVFVTPVTPRPGFSAAQNAARAEVNAFVRGGGNCSGTCDVIVDFDQALRDPANPNRIRAAYDFDGLHVNTLGQQALADAVPVARLAEAAVSSATVLSVGDTSLRYGSGTDARIVVFATGPAARGTVELRAGSTLVGSATLVPDADVSGMSAATVTVAPLALAPGVHQLTARYAGDDRLLASSATGRLTVAKAVARVGATLRNPKNLTTRVRGVLAVTVRAAGVTSPGGSVVVRDAGRKVGAAPVAANGSAQVRLAKLPAGKRTLTVTYNGSAFVEAGAGTTLKVTVRKR